MVVSGAFPGRSAGDHVGMVGKQSQRGEGDRSGGRQTRHSVESLLRSRIRDGTYPPNTRLPSHRDLIAELQVSSATLQHACNRLIALGLVRSHGKRGTYVQAAPPALSGVALVFPEEPNHRSWNRFYSSLLRSSEAYQQTSGSPKRTNTASLASSRTPLGDAVIRPYFLQDGRGDSASFQRLYDDAYSGVLTAMLFVIPPWRLQPELFTLPIPRVVIGEPKHCIPRYQASVVRTTFGDTRERILRKFADEGRRRLAALSTYGFGDEAHLRNLAAQFGIETRPEWMLGMLVDVISAPSARTVVHLLCTKTAPDRPDCLLIEDDNLVPHATAGIIDAGLRPSDLAVAAHANFPDVTRSQFPCQRFGFDSDRIIALMLAEVVHLAGGGAQRVVELQQELLDSVGLS
jgi:hypothetical protein